MIKSKLRLFGWAVGLSLALGAVGAVAAQGAPVETKAAESFSLYSGAISEGDYIIYYDGYAMKAAVSNDRLQYGQVTPVADVISTSDTSIIWHIASSGNYWNLYNSASNSYAASTGAKNKAQLLADGEDDKSLWTVNGTSTYEFVNKANDSANVNKNLRKNGDYGFACYGTSTGGALSLYKLDSSTPAVDPEGVQITEPLSRKVGLKSSMTLTATVTSSQGTPSQEITWSSENTSRATVDATGKVTGVAAGKVTIRATATGYSSVYGEIEIEVFDPIYKMVTSLDQLAPSDTVVLGAYSESVWYFSGTPSTDTPANGNQYWSNVDTANVSNFMIRESALTQAAHWTFSTYDTGYTFANQENNNSYLGSHKTSNTAAKSGLSASRSADTKWNLSFGDNGIVTMTNSADAPSTIDYLNYKGTPEFKTYLVSAYTDSSMRIFKYAGEGIAINTVSTSVDSVSVTAGNDAPFTYEYSPAFNTDVLAIASSNTGVATVSDNNGTVTVTGVAEGEANITFKNSANTLLATIPVTVNAVVEYDHITVDASGISKQYTIGDPISVAGAKAYAYLTEDDSGDPVDVSLETIFTANPATANKVGDSVAITITGTLQNGSQQLSDSDIVNVDVDPILATGVKLAYAKASYEVGTTGVAPTEIGVVNEDATDQSVTVTSSDPSIVAVTNSANGTLSFLKGGTVTITATANDGSGKSKSVTLSSNFIYPIDRYLHAGRFSTMPVGGYSSGNLLTHALDGVNYESQNVCLKSGTSGTFQFRKETSASFYNTTGFGSAIASITLENPTADDVTVYGSVTSGSGYEEISGSNGVYTPAAGKNYTFFKVVAGNTTLYIDSILIKLSGNFAAHVNAFASTFNNTVGDNCATFSLSSWNSLKTAYASLTDEEKEAVASVTVSDLASNVGTDLDKAMKRYDNIMARFGTLEDFAGRAGGGSGAGVSGFRSNDSARTPLLVAAFAGVGALAVGGMVFLRKRKEL